MPEEYIADVLVLGSGIAGCAAALAAARAGADVLVATKASEPADATTNWAQGGVAVTRSDTESFAADIRAAADGEADPDAVDTLVENARGAVEDVLIGTLDVPFDDRDDESVRSDESGRFDLTREAGHSERRILHVDASTGQYVLHPFLNHLKKHENVRFTGDTAALDLLTHEGRVHGAFLDRDGETVPAFASATVLATGGIGACYATSTNPDGATGDGIAMAALAGAAVDDMQYVQFHPTAFPGTGGLSKGEAAEVADDAGAFLLSEALRGEGAVLRDGTDERFMPKIHPDAGLAPRDVVARAVADERERTGSVRLDLSDVAFREEFPDLAAKCDERGIDPDEGIPVAPAQHFLCGGVAVDDRGRASLDRLFAAGECARTGVHGANRLASTSLLEGLVWGLRAGETAADTVDEEIPERIDISLPVDGDPDLPASFATAKRERLTSLMDENVALARSEDGLDRALAGLRRLKGEVDAYTRTRTSRELYELRNATVCGLLVARAAVKASSAGCHYVADEAEGGPDGVGRAD